MCKIYVSWSVPVHDEFVRLTYLTDDEKKILESWCRGESVISQSINYNMSESTVKKLRKSIMSKYQKVMPYSDILRSGWN